MQFKELKIKKFSMFFFFQQIMPILFFFLHRDKIMACNKHAQLMAKPLSTTMRVNILLKISDDEI